jgi:hypothetical protein
MSVTARRSGEVVVDNPSMRRVRLAERLNFIRQLEQKQP